MAPRCNAPAYRLQLRCHHCCRRQRRWKEEGAERRGGATKYLLGRYLPGRYLPGRYLPKLMLLCEVVLLRSASHCQRALHIASRLRKRQNPGIHGHGLFMDFPGYLATYQGSGMQHAMPVTHGQSPY